MTNEQAISAFGSRVAIAAVCDVTPTAVAYWIKNGGIPYDKQCLLQVEAERRGKRRIVAKKVHDPKYRMREAA